MFNESQKKKYIDISKEDNIQLELYLPRIFRDTEKLESKYNIDVSNWSVNIILEFYKSLCVGSTSSLLMMNSQLRKYAEYCQINNLLNDNQNHFNEITYDVILNCINKGFLKSYIVSKSELYNDLDKMDCVSDAFFVLALFEGIGGRRMIDFRNLNMSNFVDCTVNLASNRKLIISTKLYELAKESSETYEYMSNVRKVFFKNDDINIIKERINSYTTNDRQRLLRYSITLQRLKKKFGKNYFSMSALKDSGLINMVNEISRTENIDAESILNNAKYREQIEYRYGKIYSVSRILQKYNNYF